MPEVKYLKKMGTPEWDYHVATPALLEEMQFRQKAKKGDQLFPYDPETKKFIGLDGNLIPEYVQPDDVRPETQPQTQPVDVVAGARQVETTTGRLAPETEDAPDPNRVAVVLAAIPQIKPADWTQKTSQRASMPKVDALTQAVGFEVSREERDAAFAQWTERAAA